LDEPPTAVGRSRDGSDRLADIPVTTVPEFTDADSGSTVEDILSESFYLEVVNQAYATEIADADGVPDRIGSEVVGSRDTVVAALQSYFAEHDVNGGVFERETPAIYLQRNRSDLDEYLDQGTRRNFTRLFTDLNNTLESFEGVESESGSLLETFGL